MNQEFFYVASNQDELPLHVLLVTPEESPRGLVQFCHGMAEHKERYLPFMEYLCNEGYACLIHDHRGHGQSVLSPEDLGYFGDNGAEALVEDLHQLTQLFRSRYPGLPLSLFGHSMGSLIVRCYLKKYDADVDSLIVSGCVSQNPGAKAGLKLVRTLQKFRSPHARVEAVTAMAFGSYWRSVKGAASRNAWICSDPAVVAAYDADPLCGFSFTLNGYEALFSLVCDTYSEDGWQVTSPDLPIHFISGVDDPCLINLEAFAKALQFLRARGYRNVSSTLLDDMRHEVLNEADHEKVYTDIAHHLK
mgnify:CR=1 FL=1